MTQIMSGNAIRCAAELRTHVRTHYKEFYNRWLKWRRKKGLEDRDGFDENNPRHNPNNLDPDPEKTDIKTLITCLYDMSRSLEDANVRSFTIFPEARLDANYIQLDPTTIIAMYIYLKRKLHSKDGKVSNKDKPALKAAGLGWLLKPGKRAMPNYKSATEMLAEHGKRIFRELFLMKLIEKKRKSHHFRYSFQTNAKAISLSFGKWIEIPKNDIKLMNAPVNGPAAPIQAKQMLVTEMIPGREYSYRGKYLINFDELLKHWTVRSFDPGVKNALVGVDNLTTENDIRSTKIILKTKDWRFRIKTEKFTKQQKTWRDTALAAIQKELDTTPYRRTTYSDKFKEYAANIYLYWRELWDFAFQKKRRELRYRAKRIRMRELDKVVDRLSKPRKGDTKILLIFGDAAKKNLFGRTKKHPKGPVMAIIRRMLQRKKGVMCWASEHRSSKLSLNGDCVTHPEEKRESHLKPRICDGVKVPHEIKFSSSCRCFCVQKNVGENGCENHCKKLAFCENHQKKVQMYDICHDQKNEEGKFRYFSRDTLAAISIGSIFLAGALKEAGDSNQDGATQNMDLGNWSKSVNVEQLNSGLYTKSWATIFGDSGHQVPFSLPEFK